MPSRDYHDYVFRNGRLLGDFDNMYRQATSVPWGQDVLFKRWYSQVGLAMVRECGPYGWILEIGCGLGDNDLTSMARSESAAAR